MREGRTEELGPKRPGAKAHEPARGPARARTPARPVVPPDLAICDACLRELFDPADRRHGYPFVECAACGPRFTVMYKAPYERSHTTMSVFLMCTECRTEHEDPASRRYRAPNVCCPRCGPALLLLDASGEVVPDEDSVGRIAHELGSGAIVAVKGVGGYHLYCDATNERAVARMRRRKGSGRKPFAVMVATAAEARALAVLERHALGLLVSQARPIVVAPRRKPADADTAPCGAAVQLAPSLAPESELIGLVLAHTPLQHLVLADLEGLPLATTSFNRAGEPIAYEDGEVYGERGDLGGMADWVVSHDRVFRQRCDESVVRADTRSVVYVRRGRGLAPALMRLARPLDCPTLAVGAEIAAAPALGERDRVLVGPHGGDLRDFDAYRGLVDTIEHLERLLRMRPERIVHDPHPDYASTRYARERAHRAGIDLVSVAHAHAHVAAVMAEHGVEGPVLGVVLDRAALGEDGALWGGEVLVGGLSSMRRAAHLAYAGAPGGEQGLREPWRMALVHLVGAGCDSEPIVRGGGVAAHAVRAVLDAIERGAPLTRTSSIVSFLDAMVWLLGARGSDCTLERMEALLSSGPAGDPAARYELDVEESSGAILTIDPATAVRRVVRDLTRGVASEIVARRLWDGVVESISRVCEKVRDATGVGEVILAGSFFDAARLGAELSARLEQSGLRVRAPRTVPPNDAGLAVGQLAVVASCD